MWPRIHKINPARDGAVLSTRLPSLLCLVQALLVPSALVRLPSAASVPSLSSEMAVCAVVREALGSRASARVDTWYVRRPNYVVAAVTTQRPALRLVVKLEQPGERPNRHLAAMAAIAQLVRGRTTVPTFEVVAVDVSRRTWLWEYLIVTQVPGMTWAELYPQLDGPARAAAQRQIGQAAAGLHTLRFDSFGQIGAAGTVIDGGAALPALERRTQQRLTAPRRRAAMLEVLHAHATLFAEAVVPTLCHEDLNPYNVVFEVRDGHPHLSGILDFESAWASTGESDLARLELWRLTAGSAVRQGYTDVAPLADEYLARRPVLQLLWCLEYAEYHVSTEHQAEIDRLCAELAMAPIRST